uniref:Protein S100-A13-like n=1 Tax=Seriola dumerili TaxID=41447 RepID=A0A3B4TMB2_SERDU
QYSLEILQRGPTPHCCDTYQLYSSVQHLFWPFLFGEELPWRSCLLRQHRGKREQRPRETPLLAELGYSRYGVSHSDSCNHISQFCQGEGEPRWEILPETGKETARRHHGGEDLHNFLLLFSTLCCKQIIHEYRGSVFSYLCPGRCKHVSTNSNACLLPSVPLCFAQDTNSSSAIKEMQRGLDENSDGKVSFQEYLTLIGYVANSLSQSKCGSNADTS